MTVVATGLGVWGLCRRQVAEPTQPRDRRLDDRIRVTARAGRLPDGLDEALDDRSAAEGRRSRPSRISPSSASGASSASARNAACTGPSHCSSSASSSDGTPPPAIRSARRPRIPVIGDFAELAEHQRLVRPERDVQPAVAQLADRAQVPSPERTSR